MKKYGLLILVSIVYLAHQDFWNWTKTKPFILGFLPVGLAYHAAYSIVACLTMAILVKYAWPKELEEMEKESAKTSE